MSAPFDTTAQTITSGSRNGADTVEAAREARKPPLIARHRKPRLARALYRRYLRSVSPTGDFGTLLAGTRPAPVRCRDRTSSPTVGHHR